MIYAVVSPYYHSFLKNSGIYREEFIYSSDEEDCARRQNTGGRIYGKNSTIEYW